MKLYLAAAFSRQEEIRKVADELENLGHIITSRWLKDNPGKRDSTRARHDLEDMDAADLFIRFSDDLHFSKVSSKLVSGARMFETGYIYASKKPIIVIGGHQNVFDYLPEIHHVENVEELKKVLLGVESKKWLN